MGEGDTLVVIGSMAGGVCGAAFAWECFFRVFRCCCYSSIAGRDVGLVDLLECDAGCPVGKYGARSLILGGDGRVICVG